MDGQRGLHTDPSQLEQYQQEATLQGVQMQVAAGIDVISNGEMGRPDFMSYAANERLTGFQLTSPDPSWIVRDLDAEEAERQFSGTVIRLPTCTEQIRYRGEQSLLKEIATFQAALKIAGHRGQAFMTAPSPGVLAMNLPDRFYHDEAAYLRALALALREEYRAVVQAGLQLQVDCPDLALVGNVAKPGQWSADGQPLYRTEQERQRFVELAIAALNEALEGLPPEMVRIHSCNGNHLGTHAHDVHLGDLIPLLSQIHLVNKVTSEQVFR
jgi:5-methyltetrahydropteroyltriglutamate--homocysteine methyltransferase